MIGRKGTLIERKKQDGKKTDKYRKTRKKSQNVRNKEREKTRKDNKT